MPSGRRLVPVMHTCPDCGDTYKWWNTRNPKGRCRSCDGKHQNAKAGPQYFAAHHRRRKYGLTQEQFVAMLDEQHNQCSICGMEFTDDDGPCVDHNHATGKNRDLLCGSCNRGLGCFDENPEWLRMAADYIEWHADTHLDTLDVRVDLGRRPSGLRSQGLSTRRPTNQRGATA